MIAVKHNGNFVVNNGIIIYSPYQYSNFYAKNFIEYNLDNGYALGYSSGSIDKLTYVIMRILDKLDLHYLCSHNPLFGTVNLVNPEKYRARAFGGLNWGEGGVLGNRSNGYLSTGFNPYLLVNAQRYQRYDACRGGVVSSGGTGASNNRFIDGTSLGESYNYSRASPSNAGSINSSNPASSIDLTGTGLRCISRNNDINIEVVNNDTVTQVNQTTVPLRNVDQSIFRYDRTYSDIGLSSYFMGAALTYEETQLYRTAFNQLQLANGFPQIA